jgi:cysteine desulfurase
MWNILKNKLNFKALMRLRDSHVYMDTASATETEKSVILAMHDAEKVFANPSSLHKLGVLARNKIESSRATVAKFISAHTDEIIFTGSGTEGDNLAILGVINFAKLHGIKTPHVIVSSIEHSAVIGLVQKLELQNEISVSYLPVDENGVIDLKALPDLINENTVLVSIHLVNNELGTIEPVKEGVKIINNYKKQNQSTYPLVHTDACQASAYIKINVNQLGVDLLTINGQKMYGPKGVGALFVKRDTPIEPIFVGGDQENSLRPGTEALTQIVGLAKACSITELRQEQDFVALTKLRNYFITEIEKISNTIVHAKKVEVSPHIINVEFKNMSSETLVLYLDSRGIYTSSKSACKFDDPNESYVLKAIKHAKMIEQEKGADDFGSIRFSLGRDTTKSDIDYVIKNLKDILIILKI